MKPYPAPDYILVFDGGSRGNPGPAYGSYRIQKTGEPPPRPTRLRFGRATNNEAEYRTLIAALEALLAEAERRGLDPAGLRLEVRGDSLLVLRQLEGAWKARDPRMARLRDRALASLKRFGAVRLRHQLRPRSVAVLGH